MVINCLLTTLSISINLSSKALQHWRKWQVCEYGNLEVGHRVVCTQLFPNGEASELFERARSLPGALHMREQQPAVCAGRHGLRGERVEQRAERRAIGVVGQREEQEADEVAYRRESRVEERVALLSPRRLNPLLLAGRFESCESGEDDVQSGRVVRTGEAPVLLICGPQQLQ